MERTTLRYDSSRTNELSESLPTYLLQTKILRQTPVPKTVYKQRIAIARAVVINPKLVLADELTGNLNSKKSLEVILLLIQLNHKGTTVLMVTHSKCYAGL